MDIYQLLPLLDGWERDIEVLNNIIVKKDEEKKLAERIESGWIVGGAVSYIGSQNCMLNIYFHDRSGKRHVISATAVGVGSMGYIGASSINGATLTFANTTKSIYVLTLNPPKPIPFTADRDHPIKLTFTAKDFDAKIYTFVYEIVYIIDKDAFINSLRDLIGGGFIGRY